MAGTVINISGFSGEQPRILPRLLPETAAKSAIDVRLDDGGLTPAREDIYEATLVSGNTKTIYRLSDGLWLEWDAIVHAAPGPVASERLYYTGDGAPKMRVFGTAYPLALERPAAALAGAAVGSGSGDIVTRVYVYTYVTSFGEESEPSAASNPVDWQPGETVNLSGFTVGASGRGIAKQRLYRSQTGQAGTYFYLIAERDVSASDFTDNVAVDAFQESLPSADWNAAPAGLRGLTELPNGFFAAFIDRQIHFSEPWHPHAWPEKYIMSTNYTIVGLGAIGGVLVVLTDGMPYVLQGTHPAAMAMDKIEQNAACINERSIVDLGYAVAYASNDGLAAVRADGSVSLVSANLFNRDDWLALDPATMIGAQMFGRYVAFYDTLDAVGNRLSGALFFDLAGTPFMVRTAARATAAWFDITNGALYYARTGGKDIYRYDAPAGIRRSMYWRSKEFVLPYEENFGAIRVDSDGSPSGTDTSNTEDWREETIAANQALIAAGSILGEVNATVFDTLAVNGDILTEIPEDLRDGNVPAVTSGGTATIGVFADGIKVHSFSTTDKAVRLPSGFLARTWEIDVSGTRRITQITMAKSMDDLKRSG